MIRPASDKDFQIIYEIINDASIAYKGIIPDDRWHDPYMSADELKIQIAEGVCFFCFEAGDEVSGVMGIQDKGDVNLIRHAYVKTKMRNQGIGRVLLEYLMRISDKVLLVGTWEAAVWAVEFYKKSGFFMLSKNEKDFLLKKYWNIPERQIETSVVLADKNYKSIYTDI